MHQAFIGKKEGLRGGIDDVMSYLSVRSHLEKKMMNNV